MVALSKLNEHEDGLWTRWWPCEQRRCGAASWPATSGQRRCKRSPGRGPSRSACACSRRIGGERPIARSADRLTPGKTEGVDSQCQQILAYPFRMDKVIQAFHGWLTSSILDVGY